MSHLPPLAARMRPTTLDAYVGHTDLIGPGTPLRAQIDAQTLQSLIIWSPAGTGKTSLARIIAASMHYTFYAMSATSAIVKDIRDIISKAYGDTILFLDEIHRFSKSQQDVLLHAVEDGALILIGATTENPSFSCNKALLSRCRVLVMEALTASDIEHIVIRALTRKVKNENQSYG